MTKTKMKIEAINRLEVLTEKYKLTPKILAYFKEGRVYYSYLTAMGVLPSFDTISYDPRYEEAVRSFEEKTGCLVYHAVEAQTTLGPTLSLLYVGENEDEWETERLYKDYIFSYTITLENSKLSEFGDILLGRSAPEGVLVRIG